MRTEYDVVVVGSGFGGSILAAIAAKLGLSVLLLEKGSHPRFAIGESTSPLANLLIEEMAVRYNLPALQPISSYGAWKRAYPRVVCGLKRGFTFYHHQAGHRYQATADRSNQLMVAASQCDELADTHWLRSDVDCFLMEQARDAGADYADNATVLAPRFNSCGNSTIMVSLLGEQHSVKSRLLVDATGPRGFLSRSLNLGVGPFKGAHNTCSLFSHFTGVRRCADIDGFVPDPDPPYPPDDAALHHVFDGGWMWVLRFENGVTSAGVVAQDWLAAELGLHDGEAAWQRFLDRFPSIAEQFADATPIRGFDLIGQVSSRVDVAAGPGWIMLPSAASFVDPLFSTGFVLTLLGIERIARVLEDGLNNDRHTEPLEEIGRTTLEEADSTAEYIQACYSTFQDFASFPAISMFYFVAASFSELARRLGRRDLVTRFMALNNRDYACAMHRCCNGSQLRSASSELGRSVYNAALPLNVAGLCDPAKHNWYKADLADVVAASNKFGLSSVEMSRIIEQAAWAKC